MSVERRVGEKRPCVKVDPERVAQKYLNLFQSGYKRLQAAQGVQYAYGLPCVLQVLVGCGVRDLQRRLGMVVGE